jgi:hypothetical protein
MTGVALRGSGALIPIKEFVKGARITSRSRIVEVFWPCVEGSRALALFGKLKGE